MSIYSQSSQINNKKQKNIMKFLKKYNDWIETNRWYAFFLIILTIVLLYCTINWLILFYQISYNIWAISVVITAFIGSYFYAILLSYKRYQDVFWGGCLVLIAVCACGTIILREFVVFNNFYVINYILVLKFAGFGAVYALMIIMLMISWIEYKRYHWLLLLLSLIAVLFPFQSMLSFWTIIILFMTVVLLLLQQTSFLYVLSIGLYVSFFNLYTTYGYDSFIIGSITWKEVFEACMHGFMLPVMYLFIKVIQKIIVKQTKIFVSKNKKDGSLWRVVFYKF